MAAKNPYLRILEKYKQKAGVESQEELGYSLNAERTKSGIEDLNEQIILEHDKQRAEKLQFKQGEMDKLLESITSRLQHSQEKRMSGASKQLSSDMLALSRPKEFSARMSRYTKSSDIRVGAINDIGRTTTSLENMVDSKTTGLESIRNKMTDLIDPETNLLTDEKKYKNYATSAGLLEKDIAKHGLSLDLQRRQGIDLASTLMRGEASTKAFKDIKEQRQFNAEVATGGIGSIKTEYDELSKKMRTLNEAMTELSSATDDEKESKESNLKKAQNDVNSQQKRYDAASSGGNRTEVIGRALKDVAKVIGAFSQGYGAIAIDQPMRIMRNHTRFMDMQNEQYSAAKSMSEGDQMSYIKMMGMYGSSAKYSEKFLDRGSFMMGSRLASQGMDLTGDIAIAGAKTLAANSLAGPAVGGAVALSNAGDIAKGMAGTATTATDWFYKITAGQVAADARDRYKEFFESTNTIKASQMQQHENQYRKTYDVGTGLGTTSNIPDILMDYDDGSLLSDLSKMNVSPTRASNLSILAGQTIGGKDFKAQSLRSAAEVEMAGLTSAEQYLQLSGGASNISGTDKDLYSTLKSAITIGMDDSKNINRMVSATVSLADKSASVGVMAYSGLSESLARAANFGEDSLMTKSQQMNVATKTMSALDDLYSRGGTDIYSMQELAAITKVTRNTNIGQSGRLFLEKAGEADIAIMNTLAYGDKNSNAYRKAAASYRDLGLGDLVDKPEVTKNVIAEKRGIVAGRIMGLVGNDITQDQRTKIRRSFMDRSLGIDTPEKLSEYVGAENIEGWNDFLNRAGTSGLNIRAALRNFNGPNVAESEITATDNRAAIARRRSISSSFQYGEGKKGEEALLDLSGYKKTFQYDMWEQDLNEKNENSFLIYNDETREKMKKKKWLKDVATPGSTAFQEDVSQAALDKTQADRDDEVKGLKAPGALLDASKTFSNAAGIFSSSINDGFVRSVDNFNTAVEKFSGVPKETMPEWIQKEQTNMSGRKGRQY